MKGLRIFYGIISLGCLGNLIWAIHDKTVHATLGWFSAFILSIVALVMLLHSRS